MSNDPFAEDFIEEEEKQAMIVALLRDGTSYTEEQMEKVLEKVRGWKVGAYLFQMMLDGHLNLDLTLEEDDVLAHLNEAGKKWLEEQSANGS